MRFIFTLIFLSILAVNCFSQTNNSAKEINITGRVIEKTSQEPLVGASITLHNVSDSTLAKGTIADSLGDFSLNVKLKEKYYLEISFIGFVTYTIQDLSLIENKDFGNIYLESSGIFLDAVTVTGEKSLFETHLEKKVYNVEKDIMAESSSASEIMQNIPSITVDINGGITLRNTTNITYFINGKPSALLRRNPSAVLQQIPASSIKKIEIITNPSAKYRPDGVGGIINIVLKKETADGLNGQISANVGNEERYNTNINLNYGKGDFKLFGNYGFRHSNSTVLFKDNREYKDSLSNAVNSFYNEAGQSATEALSHNVFAGINYDLNDYNTLEFSGSYFQQNSFHSGSSDISGLNSSGIKDYQYTNIQTNDEYEKEGELNFTYEHTFKNNEDHTLSFEATYAAYSEQEAKTFYQEYTFPTEYTDTSNYLIQKSGNQSEIIIDYTLPIGEDGEFEGGYAGEFIYDDISYTNNPALNRFLFNQQLHALYGLYGQSIEDFSFKIGLRTEQTMIKSHLAFPIDSLVPNNYFKLFPTVHVGYEFDENKQISLSYSKRLNRPDPDELNPFPEFSDPRNAEAGNPNLKPEQVHSLEMGYQFSSDNYSITSSLYYRYKYDAFTAIFENIGDSIVLYTTTNLNTRQSGGLEGVLSGKLFGFWNYNLTANIYFTTIDASNLGYSNNKSGISGNIKGNSLLKIAKNTSVQLNAYYYFPSITPQGSREPFYYFNIGFKQNLFKNKASLTLTGTDVFHNYKIKYNIESKELIQYTSINRKHPVFYLGFVWRFNSYKEKDKIEFENNGLVK